jgi:hypothetical protein
MSEEVTKARKAEPDPATIDATFRNGSLTAMGVVVGFSLGFMSRWASTPGEWSHADLVAVAAITLGMAFQIKALADLLARTSLSAARYDRSVRFFLVGLVLVAAGVMTAVFAEVFGFGGSVLVG